MIKRYLHKINNTGEFGRLFANFFYLVLTNGINFVLPIVVIPFLLQKIGLEKFGLVMTAQAVMSFLVIVTEYSFNNTGTQEVSVNRDNTRKIEEIFSIVFTTKLFLLFIGFVILILLVSLHSKFRDEKVLYLLSFGIVVGKTLLPIWFLLGIEQMKYISYANLLSKIILTIILIVFIDNPSKYLYVNVFYSVGDIVSGVLCIMLLKKYLKIKVKIVDWILVKEQLKSGWYLFVTSISINISVNSNIIILSILTNNSIAGMYSIAEKVMLICKQVSGIIVQASFPYASKLAVESEYKLLRFFRIEFYSFLFLFSILGGGVFFFSAEICVLINKKEIAETIKYIKYFSVVPLLVSLNAPAYQLLIIYKIKKSFSAIIVLGSILSISLNYFFIPLFSALGTVLTVIISESFITLGLYSVLIFRYRRYNFLLNIQESKFY